jgi:hypothetical protein
VNCSARDKRELPKSFVDYDDAPREILLSVVNSMVDVHTSMPNLYSTPPSTQGRNDII